MKRFTLLLLLLLALPMMAQVRSNDLTPAAPLQTDPEDRFWDDRFGPPNGLTGPWYSGVTSLVRSGNFLYAGGRFTHAGGTLVNNLARYDGIRWQPVISGND